MVYKVEHAKDSDKLNGQDPSYYANANHDHDSDYAPITHGHTTIGSKEFDETDIADGKVIKYNSTTEKFECEDDLTGGTSGDFVTKTPTSIAEYWVSPTGDNGNDGSSLSPFATTAYALAQAKAYGDVWLDGFYEIIINLEAGVNDAGFVYANWLGATELTIRVLSGSATIDYVDVFGLGTQFYLLGHTGTVLNVPNGVDVYCKYFEATKCNLNAVNIAGETEYVVQDSTIDGIGGFFDSPWSSGIVNNTTFVNSGISDAIILSGKIEFINTTITASCDIGITGRGAKIVATSLTNNAVLPLDLLDCDYVETPSPYSPLRAPSPVADRILGTDSLGVVEWQTPTSGGGNTYFPSGW